MGTRIETYSIMDGRVYNLGQVLLKPGEIGRPKLIGIINEDNPKQDYYDFVMGLQMEVKCVSPERTAVESEGDFFFLYGDGEKEVFSTEFEELGIKLSACITNFHEKRATPDNL